MRLGWADSVVDLLEEVRRRVLVVTGAESRARLVSLVFDQLPARQLLIDALVHGLGQAALGLWPDWPRGYEPAIDGRQLAQDSGPGFLRGTLCAAWLEAAEVQCRRGQVPLPPGYSQTVQVSQLGRVLGPEHLWIVLVVAENDQPAGSWLALARGAEWLGRCSGARVLVLVPTASARLPELDGINFEPFTWPVPPAETAVAVLEAKPFPTAENHPVGIWPIVGRPHPLSPGEQRLAQRLEVDPDLSGLFLHNVRVKTRFETFYLVDLLWPEGRLVVEVDGYEHHSSRLAFASDRHRDYELSASGFRVLRLTHHEVLWSIDQSVAKIRNLVLLCRD